MADRYREQVILLLRILPSVAREEVFGLKGGTAINLFERNLPRLSVDIDLTYLGTMRKCGVGAIRADIVYRTLCDKADSERSSDKGRNSEGGERGRGRHHAVQDLAEGLEPNDLAAGPGSRRHDPRELHGIFQVAMGWEGIHLFAFDLRAVRYGSPELAARSPDIALGDLQLRKGARFAYEYDLNIPWEHEVRLEARLQMQPRRHYPYCVDGHGAQRW